MKSKAAAVAPKRRESELTAWLAFDDAAHVDAAKIGILAGSLVTGLIGAVIVRAPVRMPRAAGLD